MQVPVLVLSKFVFDMIDMWIDQNTKRESGRRVQLGNIQAAKVYYLIITIHQIGSCWHHSYNSGSSKYVEDAFGPYGRYSSYEWR